MGRRFNMSNKQNVLAERVAQFVLNCNECELRELTVATVAEAFRVDRSHLSREFSANIGCTLCRFILKEKMFRAATVLSESSAISILELSDKLGFFSPNHFSRIFKESFGILPSKYREYRKQV